MRIIKTIALLLLLGTCTVGCGMSEGQNDVLYLGSVTVQERRLESDAHEIEAVLKQGQASGQVDIEALTKAIGAAKLNARQAREEIGKLNVPRSAEAIHELYKQMFAATLTTLEQADKALKPGSEQQREEAIKAYEQARSKIAELDQQILEEKRKLSKEYQEVQLPEASPSTDGSQL